MFSNSFWCRGWSSVKDLLLSAEGIDALNRSWNDNERVGNSGNPDNRRNTNSYTSAGRKEVNVCCVHK